MINFEFSREVLEVLAIFARKKDEKDEKNFWQNSGLQNREADFAEYYQAYILKYTSLLIQESSPVKRVRDCKRGGGGSGGVGTKRDGADNGSSNHIFPDN